MSRPQVGVFMAALYVRLECANTLSVSAAFWDVSVPVIQVYTRGMLPLQLGN